MDNWIRSGHVVHEEDGTLVADLRRRRMSSAFEAHCGNAHLTLGEVSRRATIVVVAPQALEVCRLLVEAHKSCGGYIMSIDSIGSLNDATILAQKVLERVEEERQLWPQ